MVEKCAEKKATQTSKAYSDWLVGPGIASGSYVNSAKETRGPSGWCLTTARSNLGVFLLGMLVHCRVTTSIEFTSTHLYTWLARDITRIKCFALQEHDTMSPPRARIRTARSGVERSHLEKNCNHYLRLIQFLLQLLKMLIFCWLHCGHFLHHSCKNRQVNLSLKREIQERNERYQLLPVVIENGNKADWFSHLRLKAKSLWCLKCERHFYWLEIAGLALTS